MALASTREAELLDQLHAEVSAWAKEHESDDEAGHCRAFTALVAQELTEYGNAEGIELCHLEENTGKGTVCCDGYWLDEQEERLDLFVSFYSKAAQNETITQTEIRHGFERARRILQLIDQGWGPDGDMGPEETAMVNSLRAAAGSINEVRVFIFTDRVARDTEEVVEAHGERQTRCLIWDATRLSRVRQSGREYESIEIDVVDICGMGIPCLPMPESDCGYAAGSRCLSPPRGSRVELGHSRARQLRKQFCSGAAHSHRSGHPCRRVAVARPRSGFRDRARHRECLRQLRAGGRRSDSRHRLRRRAPTSRPG